MVTEIRINQNGIAYISKDLVEIGFVGPCTVKTNHIICAIFHPESTIDTQIEALKIILQDLELQQKVETRKLAKEEA